MKFDEFLRSAAKDYKTDTNVRSEVIWDAIAPDVAKAIAPKDRSFASLRAPAWIGIGVAATLLIGIGVGRWSAPAAPTGAAVPQRIAASTQGPVADSSARASYVRSSAMAHLEDAEVFLTAVRADIKAGRSDAERVERSRELLSRTRLLLGGTNQTPQVHQLLEDLELLLAEIAATQPRRIPMDQKLLDESMREGNLIPRIRATLPAVQAGT